MVRLYLFVPITDRKELTSGHGAQYWSLLVGSLRGRWLVTSASYLDVYTLTQIALADGRSIRWSQHYGRYVTGC